MLHGWSAVVLFFFFLNLKLILPVRGRVFLSYFAREETYLACERTNERTVCVAWQGLRVRFW